MTLNNVKPRSAMKRFSRSTVSATDLLLNLVMTEDCAPSNIRIPSGVDTLAEHARAAPWLNPLPADSPAVWGRLELDVVAVLGVLNQITRPGRGHPRGAAASVGRANRAAGAAIEEGLPKR
jgi:hypothetical protein